LGFEAIKENIVDDFDHSIGLLLPGLHEDLVFILHRARLLLLLLLLLEPAYLVIDFAL